MRSRRRRIDAQPLLERDVRQAELRLIEHRVGEHFLDVVARLVEGDGLGVDRAFDRRCAAPSLRPPGPALYAAVASTGRPSRRSSTIAQIVRAELRVDARVLELRRADIA